MRRQWLFVALMVGVLTLGITGGAVMAQEDGTGGDSPVGSFVSRVAAILGLEESQVKDAFKQAAGEVQDEALQHKLDRLVEQGRLTQEQADEYRDWYQSRPEGVLPGLPFRGFGGHGLHRGGMMGGGHGMMGGGYGMMWGPFEAPPLPTPEDSGATSF